MFQVKASDLGGRIGSLETKSGVLETPALLPVIHPSHQQVPVSEIADIGFRAVMTNAYIAMDHHEEGQPIEDIHKTIGFEGIIMTDSGGYQVLEHGSIDTDPLSMTKFEESISTDIAVTLDTPTGRDTDRPRAKLTVEETYHAAKITLENRSRDDIIWAGPIQGGIHLDLVRTSARKMSELGFDILALGSPTEIMKSYDFSLLADMIHAAKRYVSLNRPLHLFGAGHPLTIPLAVALGCDLFDSASYMLYARERRYLTEHGTEKLRELNYLPCACAVCSGHTLRELVTSTQTEVTSKLALHNLYQLYAEVERVKQAIEEGRLWEYVGMKARAHPNLWDAYRQLDKHIDLMEDGTPAFKSKGAFFFTSPDHQNPEARRHVSKLQGVSIPKGRSLLILIPEEVAPFTNSQIYKILSSSLSDDAGRIQFCFLSVPFGVVPAEISDIFPLSQHISSKELILEPRVTGDVVRRVSSFVKKHKEFKSVLIVNRKGYESLVREISKEIGEMKVIDWEDVRESAGALARSVKKLLRFNG